MGITNIALAEFNNILKEELATPIGNISDKEVKQKLKFAQNLIKEKGAKDHIYAINVAYYVKNNKSAYPGFGEVSSKKEYKNMMQQVCNSFKVKEPDISFKTVFNKNIDEEYSLVGQDGNAFSVMGYTARCMKKCGFKKADIDEMRKRAMSGDYDNLIVVCDEYIQKCNKIAESDDLTEGAPSGIPYEPVIPTEEDVESMSFDELLSFWWDMNGMAACYDMQMEPDEIDTYWKNNPEELLYTVKESLPYFESGNLSEDYDLPIDDSGTFAGWIAQYRGNKIEIDKSEANGIYEAQQIAIKKLKVPKSKLGYLSIHPAYDYDESYKLQEKRNPKNDEVNAIIRNHLKQQTSPTPEENKILSKNDIYYDQKNNAFIGRLSGRKLTWDTNWKGTQGIKLNNKLEIISPKDSNWEEVDYATWINKPTEEDRRDARMARNTAERKALRPYSDEYKRNKSFKLKENAEPEIYNKPGEFWYFTKHGIGPGAVPKGINIEKIIDGDGGEYFLVKDKILSTSALNKYEIQERSPKNIRESVEFDTWYNSLSSKDQQYIDDIADENNIPYYDEASDSDLAFLMDQI